MAAFPHFNAFKCCRSCDFSLPISFPLRSESDSKHNCKQLACSRTKDSRTKDSRTQDSRTHGIESDGEKANNDDVLLYWKYTLDSALSFALWAVGIGLRYSRIESPGLNQYRISCMSAQRRQTYPYAVAKNSAGQDVRFHFGLIEMQISTNHVHTA